MRIAQGEEGAKLPAAIRERLLEGVLGQVHGVSFARVIVTIEATLLADILAHPDRVQYPRHRA